MLEKPRNVKSLTHGNLIMGDSDAPALNLIPHHNYSPEHLLRILPSPIVHAAALRLDEDAGLSAEFTQLANMLLKAYPKKADFSIRLKDFPNGDTGRALERGLRQLLAEQGFGIKIPKLPTLSEDITRTWELLRSTAFALNGETRCTLNFETIRAQTAKPPHKDSNMRPDETALAIRSFGNQPVVALGLTGIFTRVGVGGKALLHDVDELYAAGTETNFCVFKPKSVIHTILPAEKDRWSFTITSGLQP